MVRNYSKCKLLPYDQLKDVSNGVITMISFSSDAKHIIIIIFYHFDWYQPSYTSC